MITLFNRREVYTGFSMADTAKIREIFNAAKIDYIWRTRNLYSHSIPVPVSNSVEGRYQYYIYVHKDDHVRAIQLLRSVGLCSHGLTG